MTLLGGSSRFIILRNQRTLTGEAKDTNSQVWRDFLAPVYFIGRTSRGEPFLTGDKSGVTKFQLSLRAQCELQSRFVGLPINSGTEAFCFLVLKGKFRLQQKYLCFNSGTQDISENDFLHSTEFVDIVGKPLIKKV